MGLIDDVAELRRHFTKLRTLLFDQARDTGPGSHHKVTGSPAPWNSTVGDLITDMHAGARRLSDQTDIMLGRPRGPRGSTDAGTLAALSRVAVNVERIRALFGEDRQAMAIVELAELEIRNWTFRVRQELGELHDDERPWTRAPGGLRCPNPYDPDHPEQGTCNAELWLAPGWAFVPEPPVWCRQSRCMTSWPYTLWQPLVA